MSKWHIDPRPYELRISITSRESRLGPWDLKGWRHHHHHHHHHHHDCFYSTSFLKDHFMIIYSFSSSIAMLDCGSSPPTLPRKTHRLSRELVWFLDQVIQTARSTDPRRAVCKIRGDHFAYTLETQHSELLKMQEKTSEMIFLSNFFSDVLGFQPFIFRAV